MRTFNLKEMQNLDPMQYQLLDKITIRKHDLIFEFNNLHFDLRLHKKKYFEEHKNYKKCAIVFKNAQNAVVEIRQPVDENNNISLKLLVISEFIEMYCRENTRIETLRMFHDDRAIIVKGDIMIAKQENETCSFIIPTSEVSYTWE